MRQNELLEIINNGESSKIEFKTADVHPIALAEEIVAFANFEGGTILIGVDDFGAITGSTREDMEDFVVNICRNNVRPSIIPLIEKININNKKVIAVSIPRGDTAYSTNRGLYFQGRFDQTDADTTRASEVISKEKLVSA
ncbi:MAG: ATP-binding protein [Pseudomonadota bacterium]